MLYGLRRPWRPRSLSRWLACVMVIARVGAEKLDRIRPAAAVRRETTVGRPRGGAGNGSGRQRSGRDTLQPAADQINRSNVSRLGLAWTSVVRRWAAVVKRRRRSSRVASSDAITNLEHRVRRGRAHRARALALTTRRLDRSSRTPGANRGICCGVVNRGIALDDGKALAPVIDGRMVALDRTSGKLLWSTRLLPEDSTGYSITMAPRVAGNKVIVGARRGRVHAAPWVLLGLRRRRRPRAVALLHSTGDPSKPFENKALEAAAKTWTGEWWKYGGGGSLWDGLSYDLKPT